MAHRQEQRVWCLADCTVPPQIEGQWLGCCAAPKGDGDDSWIAIERPGQRIVRFDSNGTLIPQGAQDEQYGTVFYNVGHDYTMGKSLGTHCERWIAIAGTCDTARGNMRTLELFTGGDPRACRVIIPVVGSLRAHAEVCICLAPGLDEGDIFLRFYTINGEEHEVLVAESSSWSAADANVITLELYTDIPRAEAVVFEVSTRAGLLAATDHKLITMSDAQLFFRLRPHKIL